NGPVRFAALSVACTLLLQLAECTGRGALDAGNGAVAAHASNAEPATAPPPAPPAPPPAPPRPPPPPQLPLGGRTSCPPHRLIGYCGTPGAPALGQLQGNLAAKAKALKAYAEKYPQDRKPLLVFELIVVVVQSWEGADGKWRRRIEESVIDDYLKAA